MAAAVSAKSADAIHLRKARSRLHRSMLNSSGPDRWSLFPLAGYCITRAGSAIRTGIEKPESEV
jgi:hypothetical protein